MALNTLEFFCLLIKAATFFNSEGPKIDVCPTNDKCICEAGQMLECLNDYNQAQVMSIDCTAPPDYLVDQLATLGKLSNLQPYVVGHDFYPFSVNLN